MVAVDLTEAMLNGYHGYGVCFLFFFCTFSDMLKMTQLEFEKDDDTNGHIDYITATSVSKTLLTVFIVIFVVIVIVTCRSGPYIALSCMRHQLNHFNKYDSYVLSKVKYIPKNNIILKT